MKRLLALASMAMMMSLMVIPQAGALSLLPFEITNISSGQEWIRVEYNASTYPLQGEQVYFAECSNAHMERAHIKTSPTSSGEITIDKLVPGYEYECRAGIMRNEPSDNDPFPTRIEWSNPVTKIYTQAGNYGGLSIIDSVAGETFIDLWVSPTDKESFDQYYVECNGGGIGNGGSQFNPSPIRLTSLMPDTAYSCRAGLYRDGVPFKLGSWTTIYTQKQSVDKVQFYNYSATSNSLNFNLSGPALNRDKEYYVECEDDRDRIYFQKSNSLNGVKVTGLQPNTSYRCFASLNDIDTSVISHRGDYLNFSTLAYEASQVVVRDYEVGDTWINFEVSGGDLGTGDNYHFRCDEAGSDRYRSWTSRSSSFTLDGLKSDTSYTCFAEVMRMVGTNAWNPEARSEYFGIRTRFEGNGPDGELAPFAGFDDEPIYDWGRYRNPFPDTNLGTFEGNAAAELYRRKVIAGYSNGLFGGDGIVNRAEAAKMLILARYGNIGSYSASHLFSDVQDGAWYEDYVGLAHDRGIISGYPDGTFRPTDPINRAEFTKMMARAFEIEENLPNNWTDVPHEAWFARFAGAAGRFNYFPYSSREVPVMSPERLMTRYDVAIAIHQYLLSR